MKKLPVICNLRNFNLDFNTGSNETLVVDADAGQLTGGEPPSKHYLVRGFYYYLVLTAVHIAVDCWVSRNGAAGHDYGLQTLSA